MHVIKTSLGESRTSLLPTEPPSQAVHDAKATSHIRLAQRVADKISDHPELGLGESSLGHGSLLE